jgi:acetyltransferase-like isoleucine patch superfamily enzyme
MIVARLTALGVEPYRYVTVVHPSVTVPASCSIGVGTILLANVVLTADVTLGRHVVAMPNAVFTHDNRLDDFATVCAGVALGGAVHVGRAGYLGMNSSVRERCVVGEHAVLGMGSVLLQDLPDDETWVGSPARPINRLVGA